MNKYKFLYLFWLIPAYFLFLGLQQTAVYYSMEYTRHSGEAYIAEIIDFGIEQIAAQRSGHITIRFNTTQGKTKTLSIGISGETTSRLSKLRMVPIRYAKEAFVKVVFIPTYELQRGFILSNMAMAAVAFIITFFVGLIAHRKARKLPKEDKKELVIERVEEA